MELTSKQRAQLRGMAANLDTIVHVGKDGIGENLIKQVNDALEARELIKGRVLENSMYTAREAAEELITMRSERFAYQGEDHSEHLIPGQRKQNADGQRQGCGRFDC